MMVVVGVLKVAVGPETSAGPCAGPSTPSSPCCSWPLWMTPRPAVALNLAQLVALLSHSRFSRRKVSMEVPACIRALARMVAECATLTRASTAPLMFFRICVGGGQGGEGVAGAVVGEHEHSGVDGS